MTGDFHRNVIVNDRHCAAICGTGYDSFLGELFKVIRFEHRLIEAAIAYLVFGTIAAVVFTNQPNEVLQIFGRCFHLLNIAASAAITTAFLGSGAAAYVAIVAGLFTLDKLTGVRMPYIIALNVLFLFAGMVAFSMSRKNVATTLAIITIASGIIMLAQIIGVGEWTQLLTTHGTIAGGPDFSKLPSPALFVGYYESVANPLQGRPAGLFHSNQFASLIILVTLAMVMTVDVPKAIEATVCVTGVLSLSKAVFLGLFLMVVYYFFFVDRGKSVRFATYTVLALVVYALLFPGLFLIFFANPQALWGSVIVRIADFGSAAFGWDREANLAMLSFVQSEGYGGARISPGITPAIVDATGVRVSGYSVLVPFTPILLSVLTLFTYVVCISKRIRASIRDFLTPSRVTLIISLLTFSLASNFLSSQIFWFFAGLAAAVPILQIQNGKWRNEET